MAATIDDYRWLVDGHAAPYLAQLTSDQLADPSQLVRRIQRLRKVLSAERAHLVAEQVELRRRARDKFSAADQMFFTRIGYEQATDEVVAAYKASGFPQRQPLADLCCGIGGDLVAIGRGGSCVGVEASAAVAIIAGANTKVCGATAASLVVGRAEDFDLSQVAAWHIDPDRRPAGKRTTRIELHEPSLDALQTMLALNPNAAIKLAPAADVPAAWHDSAECEWLGSRGECRQLVVWHGELARNVGQRRATIVDAAGGPRTVIGPWDDQPPPVAPSIGRYLYEPHSAILAGELTTQLCSELSLAAIAPRVAYLTSDEAIADAAVAGFEVLETMPFDIRRVKAALLARGVGQLEVKQRGVDLQPAAIQRTLQSRQAGRAVLLLAPVHGRTTAIIARRLG